MKNDTQTRKFLTMYKMHHPKSDVERLYLLRSEGDRGVVQLELSYKTITIGLDKYLLHFFKDHDDKKSLYSISRQFPDICLDWHDIYKLPFNVLIVTKSREFQYRILNRYLTTNSSLYKIGLANSPLGTFCKQEGESLEHLLITRACTKTFWSDFITWSNQLNLFLRDLSDSDILFGFWQRKEDYLFINHMLVLAKQHIYECRNKCTYPSFTIFFKQSQLCSSVRKETYEFK